MGVQAKVYCIAVVLTVVMGYMGGVALSQVECEQGCKQIRAVTSSDGGRCIAYDPAHCESNTVWVDQPEKNDYGNPTSCVPVSPQEDVLVYTCENCLEVCCNVGAPHRREMSVDLYDCQFHHRIDRNECT